MKVKSRNHPLIPTSWERRIPSIINKYTPTKPKSTAGIMRSGMTKFMVSRNEFEGPVPAIPTSACIDPMTPHTATRIKIGPMVQSGPRK